MQSTVHFPPSEVWVSHFHFRKGEMNFNQFASIYSHTTALINWLF